MTGEVMNVQFDGFQAVESHIHNAMRRRRRCRGPLRWDGWGLWGAWCVTLAAQPCGVKPTASCRRERRVPEAGRAGSGTAGCSGRGVTSVTISSAMP
jgi:hypothetical protein